MPRTIMIKRFGVRIMWFAGLWLVLVEGELHHPGLAILAILAAAAMAVQTGLGNHWRVRLRGLAGFIPFFIKAAWIGAIDVAVRAFRPGYALDPKLIHHTLRIPVDSPAQAFFVGVVNLVPGTLCVAFDGPDLTLHVIDKTADPGEVIRELEGRVAALFGHALEFQAKGGPS